MRGARVTASLLSTLGLASATGRGLEATDESPGAAGVALISDAFWHRRFGGSPDAVGRQIIVDGAAHTIVGVLASGIDFPMGFSDLWLPLTTSAEAPSRAARSLLAIGRLRPGVSMEEAQAEVDGIAARLEAAYPETNRGWSIRLLPVQELIRRVPRRVLSVIFGVVAFVLPIACANVANLLLARSVVRTQEMAVRSALGASRLRLLRQVLLESLVLAVLGGALGLLLARWGVAAFGASLASGMPNALAIDGSVLAFTLAVAMLTGVVFGLVPAFRLARSQTIAVLREGSRGLATSASGARLQSTIAVAEVALAVTPLVGAGVLLAGLYRLHAIDPGFRGDHVRTAELSVRSLGDASAEAREAFYEQVLARLAAQPGVRAAAAVTWPPMTSDTIRPLDLEGQPRDQPLSLVRPMDQVVADYLTAARLTGAMIGLFGLLALVLSAMGLFGVIAYLVNLRTHEFGIRIALGATPRDLLRLVVRRSVLLTGTGTLLGLVGGFAAANLLRAVMLSEIRPEPAVFVGVVAVLAGIALAASLCRSGASCSPARR